MSKLCQCGAPRITVWVDYGRGDAQEQFCLQCLQCLNREAEAAAKLLAAREDLLIVAEESGADTLAQIRARAAIQKARGE